MPKRDIIYPLLKAKGLSEAAMARIDALPGDTLPGYFYAKMPEWCEVEPDMYTMAVGALELAHAPTLSSSLEEAELLDDTVRQYLRCEVDSCKEVSGDLKVYIDEAIVMEGPVEDPSDELLAAAVSCHHSALEVLLLEKLLRVTKLQIFKHEKTTQCLRLLNICNEDMMETLEAVCLANEGHLTEAWNKLAQIPKPFERLIDACHNA